MADTHRVRLAAWHLRRGGVLAHPTEGVWGLAADPFNHSAVALLLRMKQRPVAKGLILVADRAEHFAALLDGLAPAQRAAVLASWPGPVTWVVPDPDQLVPDWVRGSHQSVALRVSDHSATTALCAAFRGPLVSTSANLAGRPPALGALAVRRQFGAALAAGDLRLLGGATGGRAGPSEIRHADSGQILRGAA